MILRWSLRSDELKFRRAWASFGVGRVRSDGLACRWNLPFTKGFFAALSPRWDCQQSKKPITNEANRMHFAIAVVFEHLGDSVGESAEVFHFALLFRHNRIIFEPHGRNRALASVRVGQLPL